MKRYTLGILVLLFMFVFIVSMFSIGYGMEQKAFFTQIHVSPKGSEGGNGTAENPYNTLGKARDAVRKLTKGMTGDIVVYLHEGTYFTNNLKFDEQDSGSNGYKVIWSAAEGEHPVISGEKEVSDWEVFDKEKNIYRAPLDKTVQTRQLFVNGRREVRARSYGYLPYFYFDEIGQLIKMPELAKWKNQDDVEFVYRKEWTNSRCGVESMTLQEDGYVRVKMDQPGWYYARNKEKVFDAHNVRTPWYIENAKELLDTPGEWYFDRSEGFIYYIPRENCDMNNAKTIVPIVETLMTLEGSNKSTPVNHIEFKRISFYGTTLMRTLGKNGFPDAQANVLREARPGMVENESTLPSNLAQGALEMKYARSIRFDGCSFSGLGSVGINMRDGSQDIDIEACRFTDISGNGVWAGEARIYDVENVLNPADGRLKLKNITVSNCYFGNVAHEYRGGVPVGGAYPSFMNIIHNEVAFYPYSGISIGWKWDSSTTAASDNKVMYNYVHHGMQSLRDGGAIYTLGAQPRTIVSGNYVNIVRGNEEGGRGIYTDQGSAYMHFYKNVLRNIENDPYQDSTGPGKIWSENSVDKEQLYVFFKPLTILDQNAVVDPNDPWTADELAVISNAGIQKKFMHVKPDDLLPPDAPEVYTPIAVRPHQIFLEWEPTYDDIGVDYYEIYNNGQFVGRTYDTEYLIGNLESGKEYAIELRSVDMSGKTGSLHLKCKTPAAPYVVFEEDFESTPEGRTPPTNYREIGKGTIRVVKEGENQCLRLNTTANADRASYDSYFPPVTGKIQVEANFMKKSGTGFIQALCPYEGNTYNEYDRTYPAFVAFNEGKIVAYTGVKKDNSATIDLCEIEFGKWYHIKTIFDMGTSKYECYVNGKQVGKDLFYEDPKGFHGPEFINGFWSNISQRVDEIFVDNIKVTVVD